MWENPLSIMAIAPRLLYAAGSFSSLLELVAMNPRLRRYRRVSAFKDEVTNVTLVYPADGLSKSSHRAEHCTGVPSSAPSCRKRGASSRPCRHILDAIAVDEARLAAAEADVPEKMIVKQHGVTSGAARLDHLPPVAEESDDEATSGD